jgi:hypothetical protein
MTTFTEKVEELLDSTFAYGVDWTEYKDKSEHDHETSVFASKIKAQQKEAIKQKLLAAHQAEISRVLERVEKEVIGDDEEDDLNPFGMVARPMAENGLRFKQRQAINKIKGELQ